MLLFDINQDSESEQVRALLEMFDVSLKPLDPRIYLASSEAKIPRDGDFTSSGPSLRWYSTEGLQSWQNLDLSFTMIGGATSVVIGSVEGHNI